MWISIPLFLISTLVVVFIHYRKKKTGKGLLEEEPDLQFAMAGKSAGFGIQTNGFGARLLSTQENYRELENELENIKTNYENLLSGNSSESDEPVRRELEKKLQQYEKKIVQIQQAIDFLTANLGKQEELEKGRIVIAEKELELKRLGAIVEQLHKEIALLTQQNESKNNEIQKLDRLLKSMQETARQASTDARELQITYQQQTEDKDKSHFEENKKLNAQLKELNEKYKELEEQNTELQSRLLDYKQAQLNEVFKETEGNPDKQLLEAREEIRLLKDQLVNADCLEEILQEKKAAIDFLQQQMESKIRHYKHIEAKLETIETSNAVYQSEIAELRREYSIVEKELLNKTDELQVLSKQNEDGSNEVRLLKQQLVEIRDQFQALEKDQEAKDRKLVEYETLIKQKQEIIASIHHQLSEVIISASDKNKQSYTASLPYLVEQASL